MGSLCYGERLKPLEGSRCSGHVGGRRGALNGGKGVSHPAGSTCRVCRPAVVDPEAYTEVFEGL